MAKTNKTTKVQEPEGMDFIGVIQTLFGKKLNGTYTVILKEETVEITKGKNKISVEGTGLRFDYHGDKCVLHKGVYTVEVKEGVVETFVFVEEKAPAKKATRKTSGEGSCSSATRYVSAR